MTEVQRLVRLSTRIVGIAVVLAALAGLAGWAWIEWRFGDPAAIVARAEREVRNDFDWRRTRLARVAGTVAQSPDVKSSLRRERTAEVTRVLFDQVARAARVSGLPDIAVTVFDTAGTALAWEGRPSDLPTDRLVGSKALFVAQGPRGFRLIYIEPIMVPSDANAPATRTTSMRRGGAVATELQLSALADPRREDAEGFGLDTSLGTVTLRQTFAERPTTNDPNVFYLRGPENETLLEVTVPPGTLRVLRERARHTVIATVAIILGVMVSMVGASCLLFRRSVRAVRPYVLVTLLIASLTLAARALFWIASLPHDWEQETFRSPAAYASALLGRVHRSPIDLLLTACLLVALSLLMVDPVRRLTASMRSRRTWAGASMLTLARCVAIQLAAGLAVLGIELGALFVIGDTVENASVDLLRLTLLPWNSARVTLLLALLLLQASVAWIGALASRWALVAWRVDRLSIATRLFIFAAWVAPSAIFALSPLPLRFGLPRLPFLLTAAFAATVAWMTRLGIPWFRHGSQAQRLVILFVGLLVPGWFLYPSVLHFADLAKRRVIEAQYATATRNHPAELLAHLNEALRQIDRIESLPELLQSLTPTAGRPSTYAAFTLWRATDLEQFRLTSAVELYTQDGALVSRFALNFPEASGAAPSYRSAGCEWDVFGEAAPFGADERRMLHAERGVCVGTGPNRQMVGAIVLHVMLDYSALPFLSSQSPYFEFIRASQTESSEGIVGGDVELTIYGWGRSPLYTSGNRAWQMDDALFTRVYQSRDPFWTALTQNGRRSRIFVSNDREGIYVIGYPLPTLFNHLIHLAEITTLAAVAFLLLIGSVGVVRRLLRRGPYPAELLVREVRASFYRKLFLAFVAAAVVPVLAFALLVRTYVASQLRNDVEAEAVRTAAVARRVIEESVVVQSRAATSTGGLTDDVMVWISRLINQDVNIFEGARLLVTSERDLFESGLLPTRTPDAVYRAIILERRPNFVDRDQIGHFTYLMAATPVRAGEVDAILTVPLASRQREIEREIDEFDRGVHLGSLLLILVGAGIGYWMAERIGDPVQRLTRATRRIAAGDLSARVIVKTADELQRLVEAFNRMAGELQRQRQQLERTHRLEAWAEMARQVAHDIKNPLTPIQLSAEFIRRIHQDKGQPLAPMLDSCVDTILAQVRLLRQISNEFSSFGASPTVTRAPTDLRELVDEVVQPYRLGTAGRVDLRTHVEPGLPPVAVDRMLIARTLTNVMENALYAMPSGGTLAIEARRAPGGIELMITDTGYGMDEEAVARIFEPYFSTKATGTGLGLSIARRNVELHGGTIRVDSKKGEGTKVTVRLPFGLASA